MALATQCPHCRTTFRVAHDQLKLRAGLVRCGACKEIFNGIEHLVRPEAVPVPPPAIKASAEPPPAVQTEPEPQAASLAQQDLPAQDSAPDTRANDTGTDELAGPDAADDNAAPAAAHETTEAPATAAADPDEVLAAPEPVADQPFAQMPMPEAAPLPPESPAPVESVSPEHPDAQPDAYDPLQRMTLVDLHPDFHDDDDKADPPLAPQDDIAAPAESAQRLDQVIDELQSKPDRSGSRRAASEDDVLEQQVEHIDEPSFVTSARRRQRLQPVLTALTAIGCVVLLLLLAAQAAYLFRDQLTARVPQSKPWFTQACALLGCATGLPAQIDAVSIESNELQVVPNRPNTYLLTTLLRNRSATAQAWPDLELTLTDANDKPVVRRVFAPKEYLAPAQDAAKGFAPASEQSVKLVFSLADLKPAGYRVYIFYP